MPHKQDNIRLAKGIKKYIRRQKLIIKKLAKNQDEERCLIKELLGRFYKPKSKAESADLTALKPKLKKGTDIQVGR